MSPYFATVPITSHMLGPMDAVPKKRKVAQRQKRREPLGNVYYIFICNILYESMPSTWLPRPRYS